LLIKIRNEIEYFLKSKLILKLHSRKRLIQRVLFGIDFCGYNIFSDKIVLRKKTIRRFVRRYKRKCKKIKRLEQELRQYLLPGFNSELKHILAELKQELERSVVSHTGFLKYSELDISKKDYVYVNKIRLPYLYNS